MDRVYRFSRVCRCTTTCRRLSRITGTLPRGSRTPAPRRRIAFWMRWLRWLPNGGLLVVQKGSKKRKCQKWDKKECLAVFLGCLWLARGCLGVTFIRPGATSRQPPTAVPRSHQSGLACGSGRVSSWLPHPAGAVRFVRGSSELGPGPVASAPSCIAKWFWTRNEMGLDVRSRGRAGASCSKSVCFNLFRIAFPVDRPRRAGKDSARDLLFACKLYQDPGSSWQYGGEPTDKRPLAGWTALGCPDEDSVVVWPLAIRQSFWGSN